MPTWDLVRLVLSWLVNLIVTSAGFTAAALLLQDLELTGTATERLATAMLVAVLLLVARDILPHALIRRRSRTEARLSPALDPRSDQSSQQYLDALRRTTGTRLAQATLRMVLTPTALWLGVLLAHALGAPVRLSGFWATLVAALTVTLVTALLKRVTNWFTGVLLPRWTAFDLADYALNLGAVWLALALLDGVRLESGPGWQQALTLAALAGLLFHSNFEVSVPCLATIVVLVINILRLWLLAWFSVTWLELTLSISGFWTLVLTGLILTVVTWPVELVRGVAQRRLMLGDGPGRDASADPT